MRIGDRIAIMEGGRVVQVGTPDEILNNPADDYVRSFFRGVDVTNVLSARDVAAKKQVTIFEGGDNLRGQAGLGYETLETECSLGGIGETATDLAACVAAPPDLPASHS